MKYIENIGDLWSAIPRRNLYIHLKTKHQLSHNFCGMNYSLQLRILSLEHCQENESVFKGCLSLQHCLKSLQQNDKSELDVMYINCNLNHCNYFTGKQMNTFCQTVNASCTLLDQFFYQPHFLYAYPSLPFLPFDIHERKPIAVITDHWWYIYLLCFRAKFTHLMIQKADNVISWYSGSPPCFHDTSLPPLLPTHDYSCRRISNVSH